MSGVNQTNGASCSSGAVRSTCCRCYKGVDAGWIRLPVVRRPDCVSTRVDSRTIAVKVPLDSHADTPSPSFQRSLCSLAGCGETHLSRIVERRFFSVRLDARRCWAWDAFWSEFGDQTAKARPLGEARLFFGGTGSRGCAGLQRLNLHRLKPMLPGRGGVEVRRIGIE